MTPSLILRRPDQLLVLRRLPAGGRPGALERYSFALVLFGVLLGLLGIVSALLRGAGAP